MTAELAHANGLQAGAPVEFQGVHVGEVDAVRAQGEAARVELTISPDHELALHEDACALTGSEPSGTTLVLLPGRAEAAFAGEVVPACSLELDDLRALGDALGDAVGGTIQRLQGLLGGDDDDDSASAMTSLRDVGRTVGEAQRELGQGLVEGATGMDGELRDFGRSVGMAARELGEGLEEGLGDDTP